MQGRTSTLGFVVGVVASGLALTAIGTTTDRHRGAPLHPAPVSARPGTDALLAKLPTAFAPVRGGFLARGSGYDVFLDGRGALLALQDPKTRKATVLRSTLLGARRVAPRSESRLPGVLNEYRGPRSTWREHVPTYARVRYPSVYDGIDTVYHGKAGTLEYDFEIAPGADPGLIALRLQGARSLRLAANGDLLITLPRGTARHTRPVAFQRIDGRRVPVGARYELAGTTVRFVLGDYDRSRPLVIDPVLSYATYFGAGNMDKVNAVALGADGSVYMAGGTFSTTLPGGPSPRVYSNEDAFVTRIAADGASTIYTTMLGGAHANAGWIDDFADDHVNDMMLAGATAVITGGAKSNSWPESDAGGSIGSCTAGGENAFLTFISSGGTLGYSDCFGGGGDDAGQSLASRYIAGLSKRTLFAIAGTTKSGDMGAGTISGFDNSLGGGEDGFLVQVASDVLSCTTCTFLQYRTYIGGASNDGAYGVAYDSSNNYAVVTGDALSGDFPVSAGSALGGQDAWIARYGIASGTTNDRTYQLRYGGSGDDSARDLALDSSNNSYIVGSTSSSSLPATPSGGNLVAGGNGDGFIAKLNSSGTPTNSVFVGGTNVDSLNQIVLQQNGSSVAEYAVGTTSSGPSATFTPRNTVSGHSCTNDNEQVFVVKRIVGASPEGAVIACLGGSDSDGDHGTGIAVPASVTDGTMIVAGYTGGGFAGINGLQANHAGGTFDGFLAKLTQSPAAIDSGPAAGALANSSVEFQLSTPESGMHFGCSTPVGGVLVAGTRSTANCSGSSASYSGLADGDHTFEATAIDAFGSESAPLSRTFTVDGTPPDAFDVTSPAEGSSTPSPQPTFSWSETHDAHGVSYSVLIDDQPMATVAAPSCSSGTCTAQVVGPVVDGAHQAKIVASDGASPPNKREAVRNFTVSDPVQARFTIAPNPALVGRAVTFNGSASDDASHDIAHYEWDLDGDGVFETDGGTAPTASRIFQDAGTFTIGLRVTSTANQVATATDTVKVNDPSGAAAQVGVSINEGAQYTNTPSVKLKIVAPAATTGLLVSNDGGFAGALPQAVTDEVSWKLDSSGPERLPKTVYVRFLTGPFASANYTDDIILDERPPIVDSASIAGSPAASAAVVAAKAKTWKLKVKAHDTNSGVGFVQVTSNKRKPGKLIAYKKSVKAKSAKRPKFLRARDRAGNFSKWRKLR